MKEQLKIAGQFIAGFWTIVKQLSNRAKIWIISAFTFTICLCLISYFLIIPALTIVYNSKSVPQREKRIMEKEGGLDYVQYKDKTKFYDRPSAKEIK